MKSVVGVDIHAQTTKLEISAKKDIGHWSHCIGYKEEPHTVLS